MNPKKDLPKSSMMAIVVILLVTSLLISAIPMVSADGLQGETDQGVDEKTVMAAWTGEGSPDWSSLGYEVVVDYGNSALVKVSEDMTGNNHREVVLKETDTLHTVSTDAAEFDPKNVDFAAQDDYYIVQMKGPVKEGWVEKMTENGAEPISYLPNNAYLTTLENGNIDSLDFVREVVPYGSQLRVHPDLKDAEEDTRSVNVMVDPDSEARDLLNSYTEKMSYSLSLNSLEVYTVEVKAARIDRMKELPGLVWMEPFNEPTVNDEVATELIGGSFEGKRSYVNDLGFTGDETTVSVVDSGIDDGESETMHPDLKGRVKDFYAYGSEDEASDGLGHGTHVAGIVAGDASTERTDQNGNYYGSGVAPETELVGQRIFTDTGSFLNPDMDKLAANAVNSSAMISSNSWGTAVAGEYDAMAAAYDRYTRDSNVYENESHPMTYVFSAGNSGPDSQTIGTPGTAKNVITVGASENDRSELGYNDSDNPEEIAAFSSRGPTADGRFKPDITAPGSWISSALSSSAMRGWALGSPDDEYYEWASGTSMAAPHVSGGAALFTQYYEDAYGESPSPSLTKAALINGAVDLEGGEFGGDLPIPNNEEGWGMMDLTNTLPTDESVDYLNRDIGLETGDVYTRNVEVTDDDPLKITMAYSDVAAAPNADPTLVNDLDLVVRGPNGDVYMGNGFSEGSSDSSIKRSDSLNNVENVFIDDPVEGTYTVSVHGSSIPEDAVNRTSETDQDFSLAIRGKFNGQSVGNVKVDKEYYHPGDDVEIELLDRDLNRDPGKEEEVNVSVSSGRPDAENVLLTENGTDSHLFTGEVKLEESQAHIDDGVLQVAKTDKITVVYNDNNPVGRRETTAVVDNEPPLISDVEVADPAPQRITVRWTTDEPTTGTIYYRPTESQVWDEYHQGMSTDHEVELTDLESNMEYELYIEAEDEAGNTAEDDNDGDYYSFKTPETAPVLLVDDGGSGWDGPYPYEKYLERALDNTSYRYEVWDYIEKGAPDLSDLRVRDAVIWHTGRDSIGTLNSEDEQVISEYLEFNGKLFLSSSKYMRDVGVTPFAEDYLMVDDYDYPTDISSNVTGIPDDPITGEIDMMNISFPYSQYFAETGHIWPNPNGTEIFESWFEEPVAIRSNRSDIPFRTVFFSFPFESIQYDSPANGSLVMGNVMDWLTPPQEHDLEVHDFELSERWSEPGEEVGLEASVYNDGNQVETDVQVDVTIDGELVKSETLSSIDVGESRFVETEIAPDSDGEKEISIEITPVEGEEETEDNRWTETHYVRAPEDPIKVVLVDSMGNYNSTRWDDIEDQWYKYSNYPFDFDTASLTHEGITYSDIVETEADMLYISDAWTKNADWEFTDSEIDAISDYVASGHPIIGTAGTFNYDLVPNNQKLAPIFGLKEDAHGSWGFGDELADPFTLQDTDHPMFDGIPESYMPGDPSATSGLEVSTGHVKANSTESSWTGPDKEYMIVTNKHENGQAFYFSHMPEAMDKNDHDEKLISNSIVYGYKNSTTPEHDIAVREKDIPDWIEYGAQGEFEATVYNMGSSEESDIEIELTIDGVVRDTEVISSLDPEDRTDVSLEYTPPRHGEYHVKINATDISGEEVTINNNATSKTYVRTHKDELTVAPVDTFPNEFQGPKNLLKEIEGEWYKYGNYSLDFDLETLHSYDESFNVTYDALVESKADVLLLSNSIVFEDHIYTDSEISAIENYTRDGGAVVATGNTFSGTEEDNNNLKMLDLFGLTNGSYWRDELFVDEGEAINQTRPDHQVFEGIQDPYQPGPRIDVDYRGVIMPQTYTEVASDVGVGDASVLANTTLRSGRTLNITEHKSGLGQTVYSDYSVLHNGRARYTPEQDKQFFYNKMKFAYENTTYTPGIAHEPQEYASVGEKISVEADIFDNDDVIESATLHYSNVGNTDYDSKSMTMISGDNDDGVWVADIPEQSAGGKVEYYIEAEDASGHTTRMPYGAPENNYTTVIDVKAPRLNHQPLEEAWIGQPIPIEAEIFERSTLSTIRVDYEDVDGQEHSETMAQKDGENFTAYLPAQEDFGQMTYTIEAIDSNGNANKTDEHQIEVIGHILTVKVVDRDEDPISQLTGTLTNQRTGETAEITTSSDGSYEYPLSNLESGYEAGDQFTAEFALNGERSTSSEEVEQADGKSTITVQFDQEIEDTEAPDIVDNSGDLLETGKEYTITAEITDNIEVSEVYVEYWTDVTQDVNTTMISHGTLYQLTTEIPTDAQEFSYRISAMDSSDNWNSVEYLGREVVDTLSPAAEIEIEDEEIPVGDEVTVDASSSSDNIEIVNYTWTIDDQTFKGENVSYTFDRPGDKKIMVRVNDDAGNMDTAEIDVEVIDDTAPSAVIDAPSTVDIGDKVILTAGESTDNVEIVEYTWIISGTEIDGEKISYEFEDSGEHEIELIVTDSSGNTDSSTITLNAEAEDGTDLTGYWWIIPIVILGLILVYQQIKYRETDSDEERSDEFEEEQQESEDEEVMDEETIEDDAVFKDWEK